MSIQIANELRSIMGDGEMVQTQDIVNWARSHPDSALHNAIDWDDHHAAEQWRNHQVRRLIAIHVIDDGGHRQMVSLSIDRTREGGGYRPVDAVARDQSLREIMLQDALNELNRVRTKYEKMQELAAVWAETDKVALKPKTRRRRAANDTAPQIAA